VRVVVASYLEPELIERIEAVAPDRVEVLYDARLVASPRYTADHNGDRPTLNAAERARWLDWIRSADVMFDIDWMQPERLPINAPNLHWVQCTSAGVAEKLRRMNLLDTDIAFTTNSGIHATPLAEFVALGLLYFWKAVPQLAAWKSDHHWEYFTNEELAGSRVLLVGLGGMGRGIAKYLSAMGLEVWGSRRSDDPALPEGVSRMVNTSDLAELLPQVDALVLACPLTERTRELVGQVELDAMKPSAVLVNVSRGAVVDEPALIDALRHNRLRGAALDVFQEEPLPTDSPLWDMDNVLISPHLAATVAAENRRIVDIFTENLRRFLAGEPLINLVDPALGY